MLPSSLPPALRAGSLPPYIFHPLAHTSNLYQYSTVLASRIYGETISPPYNHCARPGSQYQPMWKLRRVVGRSFANPPEVDRESGIAYLFCPRCFYDHRRFTTAPLDYRDSLRRGDEGNATVDAPDISAVSCAAAAPPG